MLQQKRLRSGGLAIRVLGSLVVLAALAAMMYFTLPEDAGSSHRTDSGESLLDDKARRCEEQLADILEGLTPGRLGISSDRGPLLDRLNRWRVDCGSQTDEAHPSSDTTVLEKMLKGDALARALSERFLPEDSSHIRLSLLARDIVVSVGEGNTSSVNRTVSLFDFVTRSVMLINDEIRQTMPMTPYESLLFGMGTAEDRAWIFAELLRQTRTDAVILIPRGKDHAEHWLLGVIDPQAGILLFDPKLGLPIPAADDSAKTPYPEVPATLQQVRESDAAFRQLDLPDSPYPLAKSDMQDLDVRLIGSSSEWSPRMALLQFLLPQGINVDIYDGLGENELRSPGLLKRVVEAGESDLWKADNVAVWAYPETEVGRFEAIRGEGKEGSQLGNFQFVFKGPYVPRPTNEGDKKMTLVPIDKSLHFVRIEQLRGNYVDAIRDYLPVRTTVKLVNTPPNQLASEFAALWTGVSQLQRQQIRTAVGTFDRYIMQQAGSPGLKRTAIEGLADCLIAQKNYEMAANVLSRVPPGFAPRRDIYLTRRWLKLAGIDPDQLQESAEKEEKNKKEEAGQSKKSKPTEKPSTPGKPDSKMPDTKKGDAADSKPEMKKPAPKPEPKSEPKSESTKTDKKGTTEKPETKSATDKPATKSTTDKSAADKSAAEKPDTGNSKKSPNPAKAEKTKEKGASSTDIEKPAPAEANSDDKEKQVPDPESKPQPE